MESADGVSATFGGGFSIISMLFNMNCDECAVSIQIRVHSRQQ